MVIGIRGESGAGKSTLALMLSYVLNNPVNPNLFEFIQYKKEAEHGFIKGKWKVANFASTLKIAMATMYGIDFKQYEDGEFKDTKIGQTVWYVKYKLGNVFGQAKTVVIDSFSSEDEAKEFRKVLMSEGDLQGLRLTIESKELTWRDTLNEASHGLHLYLGQKISLQAYAHRFNSSTEHLIMGDVRKPGEIDLIKENGGVVIWLKRNFIFEAGPKEVMKFFEDNEYCYSLSDGNNPEKIEDPESLYMLLEAEIPMGIDCKPLFNTADTWLDGDDRHDFVFHNPLSNPKHQEAYSQMLNDVIAASDIIVDQLCKNDKT